MELCLYNPWLFPLQLGDLAEIEKCYDHSFI